MFDGQNETVLPILQAARLSPSRHPELSLVGGVKRARLRFSPLPPIRFQNLFHPATLRPPSRHSELVSESVSSNDLKDPQVVILKRISVRLKAG